MENVTRILVIRFSSIGDIVLTTPIVRGLKHQLDGEVEIHYITKKAYRSLVEHNPNVDRVITIERHVSEAKEELAKYQYDYIVDLHSNLRSRQVKRLVKAFAFTIDKRNLAKWFYVQFKKLRFPIGHVVARGYETVAPLGIQDDGLGLDFVIPDSDQVDAATISAKLNSGFVAYAIGGQTAGKVLPLKGMRELISQINRPVVLLGGKEDIKKGQALEQAFNGAVFNACGHYTIMQSASILNQAVCVVTHDTGLMHIASALQKTVFSLWFATTPEIGFSPWMPGPDSQIFEADSPKRPTSKLGNRGYKDEGIFNIDLGKVANAINRVTVQG